jgi:Hinge domain of cleavage stimulation factor subunit 2
MSLVTKNPLRTFCHVQAAQQSANMLGNPQAAHAPSQQQTTNTISGMSPKQLFKILTELKAQMQADPEKGRKVLRENLPLTKALFQAQILLGMVNPEQPAMGPHNPPPPAAPNGGAPAIKEEAVHHHHMSAPGPTPTAAPAVDPREAALQKVGAAQRGVLFMMSQHLQSLVYVIAVVQIIHLPSIQSA